MLLPFLVLLSTLLLMPLFLCMLYMIYMSLLLLLLLQFVPVLWMTIFALLLSLDATALRGLALFDDVRRFLVLLLLLLLLRWLWL